MTFGRFSSYASKIKIEDNKWKNGTKSSFDTKSSIDNKWNISIKNPFITQLISFNSESKIEVLINGQTFHVEKCLLHLVSKKFQTIFITDKLITKFIVETSITSEKSCKLLQEILIHGEISDKLTDQELCDFIQLLKDIQCDILNEDLFAQIQQNDRYHNFVITHYQLVKHMISYDSISKLIFLTNNSIIINEFFQQLTLEEITNILENENLIVVDEDQIISAVTNLIINNKDAICLLKLVHLDYGSKTAIKIFLKIFELDWMKNDQKYRDIYNLFTPCLMLNSTERFKGNQFPRKYKLSKIYSDSNIHNSSVISISIPKAYPIDLQLDSPETNIKNIRIICRLGNKIKYDRTHSINFKNDWISNFY